MAKKMKKSNNLGLILSGAAVLFALAAVCMMFVKSIDYVVGENVLVSFTGMQVAFGYSEKATILGSTLTTKILSFSFMNLLPYLLALAGGVLALLNALGKNKFLTNVISLGLFVAAAIFFFTAPAYVVTASEAVNTYAKDGFTLAIGSILSGVFSAVSAFCLVAKILVK
ncbi:MAG: hypothetical protein SPH68_08500 [Candidatus Borkfalkiaceae bacterium]|nr:hypothetical protein [Clostridia bacterium]MDY6224180.1 hypothetical protein [Christensenellaceae bacterium]